MNNWIYFTAGVIVGFIGMAVYNKIKREEEELQESFELPYSVSNYKLATLKIEEQRDQRDIIVGYDGSNYETASTTKELAERESPSDDDEDNIDEEDMDASETFDIQIITEHEFFTELMVVPMYRGEAFSDDEEEFDKVSMMYYSGDNVLLDENGEEVPPGLVKTVIGEDALFNFGHGSENLNIVYVRNHSLSIDYEIVRDEGCYYKE